MKGWKSLTPEQLTALNEREAQRYNSRTSAHLFQKEKTLFKLIPFDESHYIAVRLNEDFSLISARPESSELLFNGPKSKAIKHTKFHRRLFTGIGLTIKSFPVSEIYVTDFTKRKEAIKRLHDAISEMISMCKPTNTIPLVQSGNLTPAEAASLTI